ncbi:MAG: rRNA maturation RNase YbeY [Calditrichae bacterium]|nr:rRNA maturation RNase YbeY [Calditrichota bacterium]MCB0293716.1 rRNA maturation RNase YbeY [Calditrichota bacterium]MCB0316887.1 rRNA maturation RNase YbeY [Calditrichota bacterium]MCB9090240.1 rRNA maturation RNase YbeY [Calditrichia bacterium]
MSAIEIFNNAPDLQVQEDSAATLARRVIADEQLEVSSLNIIFVDDAYLKDLHQRYLDDDSKTDVMTFSLNADGPIEGEIYISLDRARAHAQTYRVTAEMEVARLIIHGLLHLKGYDDHTAEEQKLMREKENACLARYPEGVAFYDTGY